MTQQQVRHPIAARLFTWVSGKAEAAGQAEHRRRLLEGLSGRVVEVGAGHGLNFRHYPQGVEEVVAVEPEPYLRRLAEGNAERAPVRVRVVEGLGQRLPLEDGSFDFAVSCLVLCEVPDQAQVLREIARVLKPRGELRFYEHVLADDRPLARAQRLADRTFWPPVSGGCHAGRRTVDAIERAGFRIDRMEAFRFRPSPLMTLTAPRVLGVARVARSWTPS